MILSPLAKRCVELLYVNKLSHVSSCLNTVDLLAEIYRKREPDDPVILDNGHASLAHYVVLESCGMCDAQEMIATHGVHAHRDMEHGIWVSNGSLGQAATVALGMALADKDRTVWLVTSDGACAEGCIHECVREAFYHAKNLKIHIAWNGFGAYGTTNLPDFPYRRYDIITSHYVGKDYPEWLQGLAGHYLILNEQQRDELMA
jgi:transketolase N-terminal domain/subunit